MKKLLSLLPVLLLGGTSTPEVSTKLWTNRVDKVLSVVSVQPVSGKCPECGAADHHNREVRLMSTLEQIYQETVYKGKTSQTEIDSEVVTNWLSTNFVFRYQAIQPGWTPPPLPVSTNR